MDQKTQSAYSTQANVYSEDWLAQPEPSDMYELLQKYFTPGGTTADIGCGNGRDANWMRKNGFQVSGFDSSSELLAIARKNYPEIQFQQAFLPALQEITGKFQNVLCETVIMHLPQSDIASSVKSIQRLLTQDGILYLSWRVTDGQDARHADGRLYSAFPKETVLDLFAKDRILHFEDKVSLSSGKRVCRLIAKG